MNKFKKIILSFLIIVFVSLAAGHFISEKDVSADSGISESIQAIAKGIENVAKSLEPLNVLSVRGNNVGIGVARPQEKLDVDGYVNAKEGFCIDGDCISSWSELRDSFKEQDELDEKIKEELEEVMRELEKKLIEEKLREEMEDIARELEEKLREEELKKEMKEVMRELEEKLREEELKQQLEDIIKNL